MIIKVIMLVSLVLGTYGYPGIVRATSVPDAPAVVQQSSGVPGDAVLASAVPAADQQSSEPTTDPAPASPGPTTPQKINLPPGIFNMYLKYPGAESRFEMTFDDIPPGYEIVSNEAYPGWCVQRTKYIRKNASHEVKLYSCYDENLPAAAQGINWNQVNYVLNHQEGNIYDVQHAIWYFTDRRKDLSQEADSMVKNAVENGGDYVPSSGETQALICDSGPYKQLSIIAYKLPVVLSEAAPVPVVVAAAPEAAVPAPATTTIPRVIPLPIPIPLDDDTPDKPVRPVPEPDTLTLSLIALGILGGMRMSLHLRDGGGRRLRVPHTR
jgi:hypothetical protein